MRYALKCAIVAGLWLAYGYYYGNGPDLDTVLIICAAWAGCNMVDGAAEGIKKWQAQRRIARRVQHLQRWGRP